MTEQTSQAQAAPQKPTNAERPKSSKVDIATFVLVIVGMVGATWKFLIHDRQLLDLERREREVAVAMAEEESVSLLGQVYGPDVYIVDGKRGVPVCPVFVTVQNDGKVPTRIERIDFRVSVAALRDVSLVADIEEPEEGVVLASASDSEGTIQDAAIVGIIDPDSEKWVEKAELRKTIVPNGGTIPAGQSRTERLHVFAPTSRSKNLTKIEVTVHTTKSKQRWYGFASQEICGPIPFSSSATD